MLVFESDYTEGAHPLILEKLTETNFEQLGSYSSDKYSESANYKSLWDRRWRRVLLDGRNTN